MDIFAAAFKPYHVLHHWLP